MGIAAYNRGTLKMRRELDNIQRKELQRRANIERFCRLNDVAKVDGALTPFGDIAFCFDESQKRWWAITPSKGFRGFGMSFPDLRTAVSSFRVFVICYGPVGDPDGLYGYLTMPISAAIIAEHTATTAAEEGGENE